MPTGIDVGSRAVRVATPDGVAQYRNAVRRVSDDGDGNESEHGKENEKENGIENENGTDADAPLVVESSDGTYAVDRPGTGADDAPGDRLFGTGTAASDAVRSAVAEAFVERVADPPDEGALRYVAGSDGADPLAAVATDLGYDVAALDPGMAVCYDAFDAPATGLGLAVTAERAVATLAAAGVPVATATVDLADDWFDLGPGAADADGTTGDWVARQYETLAADLGADLAAGAPALEGPVPVAVGGSAAPSGDADARPAALDDARPFAVGEVTTTADPAAALARGALDAAEANDGGASPLAPFAVDVPFVGALADFGAATAAFGAAAATHAATAPGEAVAVEGDTAGAGRGATTDAGSGTAAKAGTAAAVGASTGVPADGDADGDAGGRGGTADAAADVSGAVARTRSELAALDRRGAMTARGLSDVVDRLDGHGEGDEEAVAALRADLDALAAQLPDDGDGDLAADLAAIRESVAAVETDLADLEETAATASAVADLESAVADLDAAVTDLEDDVDTVRAAVTGLDGDDAAVAGDALEDLAVDALQDDVEELRAEVDDRVDGVWTAVDDVESRLVDIEATADDVPDLETTVASVRNAVADLEDGTADIRESIDALRSSLQAVEADTPSTADLEGVQADLASLSDDVDAFRTEFRETEWVDPATVEQLETDLEGLRQTLINRADRLESLEETTETLRERIETVYQNSAKSEALSSLEAETARIRNTAAEAMERTNEMTETVSDLDEAVADHGERLGMVSTQVDNLAGSSVTRPEMQSSIDQVEERLDQLEADIRSDLDGVRSLADADADVEPVEDEGPDLAVVLQTTALVSLGLLGAALALFMSDSAGLLPQIVAFAFILFTIVPAVLSALVE